MALTQPQSNHPLGHHPTRWGDRTVCGHSKRSHAWLVVKPSSVMGLPVTVVPVVSLAGYGDGVSAPDRMPRQTDWCQSTT
jgi:hypothetical protein